MAASPSAAFLRLLAFIQTAAMVCLLPGEASGRQNGAMTPTTASKPIEPRLAGMVAGIRQLIPAADVRLFGSRARGDDRADSDVDLLITVPDAWLAQRDRFALLADLWGAVAQPDVSVDLVLHSSSEVARRAKEPGSLVYEAMREGVLLDGQA
jgi:predicted nucleotidyltransferase